VLFRSLSNSICILHPQETINSKVKCEFCFSVAVEKLRNFASGVQLLTSSYLIPQYTIHARTLFRLVQTKKLLSNLCFIWLMFNVTSTQIAHSVTSCCLRMEISSSGRLRIANKKQCIPSNDTPQMTKHKLNQAFTIVGNGQFYATVITDYLINMIYMPYIYIRAPFITQSLILQLTLLATCDISYYCRQHYVIAKTSNISKTMTGSFHNDRYKGAISFVSSCKTDRTSGVISARKRSVQFISVDFGKAGLLLSYRTVQFLDSSRDLNY